MNKKLLITICVLCLYGCGIKQQQEYSSEMEVVNSKNMSSSNYYRQEMTIILNRSELIDYDYEECAMEIIEHCIANDFHNIKFSYDITGYPNEINATIFLSEEERENWNPLFEMSYKSNLYEYNIKDNPEQFELEIKKDFD